MKLNWLPTYTIKIFYHKCSVKTRLLVCKLKTTKQIRPLRQIGYVTRTGSYHKKGFIFIKGVLLKKGHLDFLLLPINSEEIAIF